MADLNIGREYQDVFDLGGVPAFREFYNVSIFPAKYVYKGYYAPWHLVNAPTVQNPRNKRKLFHTNIAKAICAELAGLVWDEQAEVHITTNGAGEEDPLAEFVQHVLEDNAFFEKMQEHIEQSAALGGGALKAYVKGEHTDDGIKPGTEEICIDYCMADQFVPTAWDNAKVDEAIFVSRKAKGGYYYTKLEWHEWNGDTYVVRNELFRSQKRDDGQEILGFRYPLNEMYPELLPEVTINGLNKSLFSYYRTPIANNVDDNSPLGVSIYGNAMDTLHALDIAFDSFVREFRLGKKKIIVPAAAISTVVDPTTGELRRFFDPNDEAYEALPMDGDIAPKEAVTTLRVDEHVQAMNALLSVLCLQVGLSAGTFTFDASNGIRTATEVISENSKTYKTIRSYQNMIRPAIERLVDNILELAALYQIEWNGYNIASLVAKGYEVSIVMEDAVLEDAQSKLNRGIMLLGNGLLSKKRMMTDPAYGIGMTDEEADKELEQIANERKAGAETFDFFSAIRE